ncbi:type II toxin-antitoxin system VapB15 family antitoxin [[Limnothrix rosea] IAM M-220]|uniref:type II toxin-antitoxin system VapB15 family antitoxin n=1 Tax=[Limnothrix rosea] IAM M-220 TaxID=454133 RepID=UPI0009626365|nr:hypothetical protein [[Limnothrix rosea] IAM M-220]OKH19060.1 hypothetical protein NIES208_03575 [[Limnothrix rosea] IAM M-220]
MQSLYQLPLTFEQILSLVRQLPATEKEQIRQELETERRTQQLENLMAAFQTDELTLEEITAEVEAVRATNYHHG